LRLFDIVIAPSIAQCCSGDPVGPSKFTRDAKAPDGQPPRGRLFNEAAKASRLAAAPLPFFSQKFLQRSVVEHGFGQQLLELAVFLLERPQPLRLRYVQAAILGPSSCTTSLPRSRACAPARLPSPPASARAQPRWRRVATCVPGAARQRSASLQTKRSGIFEMGVGRSFWKSKSKKGTRSRDAGGASLV